MLRSNATSAIIIDITYFSSNEENLVTMNMHFIIYNESSKFQMNIFNSLQ
jgi:hypothetical protein